MSFARLPYELRSEIWSLVVEPRHITNVRTEKSELPFKKKHRMRGADILYQTTSTPAPAVMQVCHESRKHAPYQQAFTRGTEPRWTWVNFELDVFCITSVFHTERINPHRSQVQRLQIRTDDDDDWYESIVLGALRDLHEFVGLREIRVVMKSGDFIWGDLFAPLEWNIFGQCPWANVTFVEEGSQLILTGPQLLMVGDWLMAYTFDREGNPPDADNLSDEISYAQSGSHLSLPQMHEID